MNPGPFVSDYRFRRLILVLVCLDSARTCGGEGAWRHAQYVTTVTSSGIHTPLFGSLTMCYHLENTRKSTLFSKQCFHSIPLYTDLSNLSMSPYRNNLNHNLTRFQFITRRECVLISLSGAINDFDHQNIDCSFTTIVVSPLLDPLSSIRNSL